MQLIVTEKPSVAKVIAETLESSTDLQKENGYITGKKYTYTWALGHLVALDGPGAYLPENRSTWDIANIPIIPTEYKLVPVKSKDGSRKKQLKTILDLMNKSDLIVNAADAGREGELIFRYIHEKSTTKAVVKRLWISSYTPESITDGLNGNNLKDQKEYDNLYLAAKSRSQSDWLIGMNATIALTAKVADGNVYSLGRVQTPTFAMVAERYIENKSFKSIDFFKPVLILSKKGIDIKAHLDTEEYITSRPEAQRHLDILPSAISCIEKDSTQQSKSPPLLFDLTSLQIYCNNKFGLTAQKTLDIVQELYETKKVLSYPRTDSKYLTADMVSSTEKMVDRVKEIFAPDKPKLISDFKKSKNFNSDKVTDHHAIIPVGILEKSDTKEYQVYNAVAQRLVEAFGTKMLTDVVKYKFEFQGSTYSSTISNVIDHGWNFIKENDKDKTQQDPDILDSELTTIKSKEIETGKTRPPALFTDATLLSSMERAGKHFEQEELPKDQQNKGIGTPATRAATIEKLIKKDYINRSKKFLIPSEMGLILYGSLKGFVLTKAKLTGDWEYKFHLIENAQLDVEKYNKGVNKFLTEVILPKIADLNVNKIQSLSKIDLPCPKCKNKSLTSRQKLIKCGDGTTCDFKLWKTIAGKKMTSSQLNGLLKGEVIELKGLVSKSKKKFNCKAELNTKDYSIELIFENKLSTNIILQDLDCPGCNKQTLSEYEDSFRCSNNSCEFFLAKEFRGMNVDYGFAKTLSKVSETQIYDNLKGTKGKPYSATFSLSKKGKVQQTFVSTKTPKKTKQRERNSKR